MKKIPLTRGKFALVDDEDYDYLVQWKWYAIRVKRTYYAVSGGKCEDKHKTTLMHRIILDVPEGLQTDHRNHNGLDNRRCNIRMCTHSQNARNKRPSSHGSSQYKGVSRDKRLWKAEIIHNGDRTYLGTYTDEIKAALAYDKKAKELFGEFAYLNFV